MSRRTVGITGDQRDGVFLVAFLLVGSGSLLKSP
jgi:hypothetical protein